MRNATAGVALSGGRVDASLSNVAAASIRTVRWLAPAASGILILAYVVNRSPSMLALAVVGAAIGIVASLQHRRANPDVLPVAALLAVGVTYFVMTSDVAGITVPIVYAGVGAVATVFGSGRRLKLFVALLVTLWVAQVASLTAYLVAEDQPLWRNVDEAVSLVFQAVVFVGFALLLHFIVGSLRSSGDLYAVLFRRAPISLWREDFSAVGRWLDALAELGVEDLREHLRLHPDAIDEGISRIVVMDVNDAAARLVGVSERRDLIGPINTATVGPETRAAFVEQFVAIWEGEDSIRAQVEGNRVDGSPFTAVLNWSAPNRNGSVDLSDVMVTIDDITQLRRAEAALADTEERFGVIVERISDLVYTLDEHAVITFVSPSVANVLGYRPDELVGQDAFDLLHPDDQSSALFVAATVAPGEMGPLNTHRIKHRDGSWRHIEATATNLLDHPVINAWLVTGRDVTARIEAEAVLKESETSFRLLAENSSDLIARHAPDGSFVYVSPASYPLLGYRPDDLVGRVVFDFMHPDEVPAALQAFQRVSAKTTSWTSVHRMRRSDGAYAWFESTHKAIIEPFTGEVSEIQMASRDVTERKAFEEALKGARDVAESATIVKSQFLANMSHEIRTPMNAIVGMTELALSTDLTGEQREYLGTIKSAVDSLLSLINDILDLSKIEAGRLELEAIPFSLADVVEDTTRTLAGRASDRGLRLTSSISPDVPEGLVGDPGRLRQVLVNLIGNALKFTHVGSIEVKVTKVSGPDDGNMLRIDVEDSGIGIPAEKLETIFATFSQADGSMTRNYGGTGLGLAISRDIAGAMGGSLTVASTPGVGSVFTLTVPLVEFDDAIGPFAGTHAHDNRPVVVISDTPAGKRNVVEMLRQGKISPLPAGDMGEAVTLIEHAVGVKRPPMAIVVDWQDDPMSFAERLINSASVGEIPVVMLAALGQRGDAARYREIGVSGYLTKPFVPGELLETVRTLASTGGGDIDELITRHWLRERRRQVRVLLVDDSATNRRLAMRLLEKRRHSVVAVENGLEAIQALEKAAFDIVLMDVQMPEMDGLEATAVIRAGEALTGGHIPIVALTAHAMKGDRDRCLEAGMDAYVSKPFQAEELFATIEQLVSYTSPTSTSPEDDPPDELERTSAARAAAIDWDDAIARLGGSAELLFEVAAIFLETYPELRTSLAEHIAAGACDEAAKRAHRFKGDLAAVGAASASKAAKELEAVCKTSDAAAAEQAHARFEAELARAEPEIVALSRGVQPA